MEIEEIAQQFAMNIGFFIALTYVSWAIMTPIFVISVILINKYKKWKEKK